MERTMNKVLAIATDWNDGSRNGKFGGVTEYRLRLPLKHLKEHGWEYNLHGKDFTKYVYNGKQPKDSEAVKKAWREYIVQYDAVITKPIDNPLACALLIDSCKRTKTPLIVDLDDNFMEVTPDQPAYKKGYNPGGENQAIVMSLCSMADALFCSTQPLADYMKTFIFKKWGEIKPTYVLPNSVEMDWPEQKGYVKEIGWFGSVTHDDDIKLALDGLYEFLKEHEEYSISFVGGFTEKNFKKKFNPPTWFKKRAKFHPGTSGYEGFKELIAEQKWEIGIAPLVDTEFNRAKSNIKWIENSMIGVPVLASNVYPYANTIEDGVDGFIMKGSWKESIERVLEADRKKIVKNAQSKIHTKYNIKKNAKKWADALSSVV